MIFQYVRLLGTLAITAGLAAQGSVAEWQLPIKLRAYAVDAREGARGGMASSTPADLVQIVIERWSTDAERAKVIDAIGAGEAQLLRTLQDLRPRAGYMRYLRAADSNVFKLGYASRLPDSDGAARILVLWASDTYLSPTDGIRVIEMRFTIDGAGEGRLSNAKVGSNGSQKVIELSDYMTGPIFLRRIRRE